MPNTRNYIRPIMLLLAVALLVVFTFCIDDSAFEIIIPPTPETEVKEVKEVLHGVEIADPYRWLEDQESTETRAWIEAQNAYAKEILDQLPGREGLMEKLTRLSDIDTVGVPIGRNGRYFYTKRLAGQDLDVIYFRDGLHGQEEVLIDPHQMSEDLSAGVTLMSVSNDGKLLAYGLRLGGEDQLEIRLFDVDAGSDLDDKLPKSLYFSVSIAPDNRGLFYSKMEGMGRYACYHEIGSDASSDIKIFGFDNAPEKIVTSSLSDCGRWLVCSVYYGSSGDKTEIYLVDLSSGYDPIVVCNDIQARFTGAVYGGRLYLSTDWQAPNGRILVADPENPAQESWSELVPEREGEVIRFFQGAGGRIFVDYLKDVQSRVAYFDTDGNQLGEIGFDAIGSVSAIRGAWDSNEVFYSFSSFHIPQTIYLYDLTTDTQDIWASQDVPIDSDKYEMKQVWFESRDGTKVPMFIVHAKGIVLDGNHPTMLGGYGGFNLSLMPTYNAMVAHWISLGGVAAIANLRGGGEFGEEWHRAGMLENKQNVFDDFIAAAKFLIAEKYTRPEKLSIQGGSNGGLLVGAAMTQRPDLFAAVVCTYPLLDMVRYHNFLNARLWAAEYGSSDDPEQFKYLLAYSPYHNVTEGEKYPAVLFMTGDADTRVAPLHARKMAALLQASTGSGKPILLLYDTQAGHSGGYTSSQFIQVTAEVLGFLCWQLGVSPE